MKVIDLLNKIAKGEAVPKKIHILNCNYIWHQGLKTYNVYEPVYGDLEFGDFYTHDLLNKKVEIIEDTPKEDKKIKRVERKARNLTNLYIKDKLNEIIDRINGDK